MAKLTMYGRRVVKVKKGKSTIYVLSGQWVGHKYGNADGTGTEKQRNILLNNCGGDKVIAVSKTILWNTNGYSGKILDASQVKLVKF